MSYFETVNEWLKYINQLYSKTPLITKNTRVIKNDIELIRLSKEEITLMSEYKNRFTFFRSVLHTENIRKLLITKLKPPPEGWLTLNQLISKHYIPKGLYIHVKQFFNEEKFLNGKLYNDLYLEKMEDGTITCQCVFYFREDVKRFNNDWSGWVLRGISGGKKIFIFSIQEIKLQAPYLIMGQVAEEFNGYMRINYVKKFEEINTKLEWRPNQIYPEDLMAL